MGPSLVRTLECAEAPDADGQGPGPSTDAAVLSGVPDGPGPLAQVLRGYFFAVSESTHSWFSEIHLSTIGP